MYINVCVHIYIYSFIHSFIHSFIFYLFTVAIGDIYIYCNMNSCDSTAGLVMDSPANPAVLGASNGLVWGKSYPETHGFLPSKRGLIYRKPWFLPSNIRGNPANVPILWSRRIKEGIVMKTFEVVWDLAKDLFDHSSVRTRMLNVKNDSDSFCQYHWFAGTWLQMWTLQRYSFMTCDFSIGSEWGSQLPDLVIFSKTINLMVWSST